MSSINLSEFVTNNKKFDFAAFKECIKQAVIAMNEVLDEGLPIHPLQEQRDSVKDWRQIGIGIMGLADMLIKLGVRYGSKESIELCDNIGDVMACMAISVSNELAKETKPYPRCDMNSVKRSEYFQYHIFNNEKKKRLRNMD